ncbi:MAG: DNA cytosine methyltransferase [Ignavibacteria bacterium]|nr:DNA cytosine methyltransferase [Ignavibacteria bacterium]
MKYNLLNDPEKMVLNSCDYGVPQVRKRVILIGTRKDLNIKPFEIYNGIVKTHTNPESVIEQKSNLKKYVTVKDAISDLPKLKPGDGHPLVKHKIESSNEFC